MCQDLVSNPLEIVKIRLQVAGEVKQAPGLRKIVKELGLRGLYKGVRACIMRDANFSAIYFPSYAHLKKAFADEEGYNPPLTLLMAGSIAAVPAVFIVTPADVIKTRLQVIPREGQTVYHGIVDCAKKIMKEEGFKAFWKGAGSKSGSKDQENISYISQIIL